MGHLISVITFSRFDEDDSFTVFYENTATMFVNILVGSYLNYCNSAPKKLKWHLEGKEADGIHTFCLQLHDFHQAHTEVIFCWFNFSILF